MFRSWPHYLAPYWLVAALALIALTGCAPEASPANAAGGRYTFADVSPVPEVAVRTDAPAAPAAVARYWLWFTLPQGCPPCVQLERRIRPVLEKSLVVRSIDEPGTANVWIVAGAKHPLVAKYDVRSWPRLVYVEGVEALEDIGADVDPAYMIRKLGHQAAMGAATRDFVAPEGQLTFVPNSPPVVFAHNGNELRFSKIDAKVTSSGSTVKVKFADPRPIVSGRIWGFRVSDTLDETTISPAGVDMLTYRWKSRRTIKWE